MEEEEGGRIQSSPALQRCLQVLKAAKSDTEVFAALLLVTKLLKAEESKPEERRQVFEAVGFNFLNRLLKTEVVPESCDSHMFKSLAVTLLACFSTDAEMLQHPEMSNKVGVMAKVIPLPIASDEGGIVKGMIDDAYEFIVSMATVEIGREELCKGLVPSLIAVIQSNSYGNERAFGVLCLLLDKNSKTVWEYHSMLLNECFSQLSREFNLHQDARKFEVCEMLSSIMSSISWVPDESPFWINELHSGLYDVLRSKLGSSQRDVSLQLASSMLYHYGVPWALGQTHDKKFLLLLVNLASVEIRMILEDMSEEEQSLKRGVLCSCYSIIEKTLEYVVCHSKDTLRSDDILQLHRVISEAMMATTYHLKSISEKDDKELNPVLLASVRALSMWLAEETTAVNPQIEKILSFMLWICQESFKNLSTTQENPDETSSAPPVTVTEDIVKLMLPALCHLTSDKSPQEIFIQEEGVALLQNYLKHLWKWRTPSNKSETESSMVTMCNIFLNIILQEPPHVIESGAFEGVLDFLCQELPVWASSEVSLAILHLCLVGLALQRRLPGDGKQNNGLISSAMSALRLAEDTRDGALHPSLREDADMAKELLCLILQFLSDCVTKHSWIVVQLFDSGWLEEKISHITKNDALMQQDVFQQYCLLIRNLMKRNEQVLRLVSAKGGKQFLCKHFPECGSNS